MFIDKIQSLVELSTALIAPLVALLGLYIAFQQHKTNKMKLKSDLFDRRYALFECVHEFVVAVARRNGVDQAQRDKFISGTKGAEFLFDNEIKAYIDEVWDRAVDANAWIEDKNVQASFEDTLPHKKWFNTQLKTINTRFKKYMSLSH